MIIDTLHNYEHVRPQNDGTIRILLNNWQRLFPQMRQGNHWQYCLRRWLLRQFDAQDIPPGLFASIRLSDPDAGLPAAPSAQTIKFYTNGAAHLRVVVDPESSNTAFGRTTYPNAAAVQRLGICNTNTGEFVTLDLVDADPQKVWINDTPISNLPHRKNLFEAQAACANPNAPPPRPYPTRLTRR